MVKDSKRNFGLDLMRAIAVILVMMHHWLGIYGGWRDFFFVIFGFYGVEIFFVLSGFLIGNILIKSYLNESSFNLRSILTFWNRRWLRTVPLYYFILTIYIVLGLNNNMPLNGLSRYFFFVQNIFRYDTHNHDFYGVSWSLAIEEWFYLSFPMVLVLINAVFKNALSKVKILFLVILTFMIVSLVIRYIYAFDQSNLLTWNNQFRKAVICREDSIAFGVFGALIYNLRVNLLERMRYYFLLVGLLLLAIGFVIFIKDGLNVDRKSVDITMFSKTFYFSMISVGALLTIPFFYFFRVKNIFIIAVVTYVSKISYSLYLVHTLILQQIDVVISPKSNLLYVLVGLLIFLSSSVIVASFTYRFIELTFLNIRDKLFKEKYHAV